MNVCPHCERPTISRLRRLFLWPILGGKCPGCGERFTIPLRRQLLAAIPLILATWFQGATGHAAVDRAVPMVAVTIAVLLQTFWGPLVKKREGEFW